MERTNRPFTEEIQAVERRLHFKLPTPIRTLYYDGSTPLSSHTELLEMNTHILMAYVSKNLKFLLVLLDGDIALTLLTANPAGTDTLREIEKNIKLSFDHC